MRCRVILVTFLAEAIKYPDRTALGRRGLFGLPLQGCNPSQWKSWGGRSLNHLLVLCLQSGRRRRRMYAQPTVSGFWVPGPQPGKCSYTQCVRLPTSPSLIKTSSHNYAQSLITRMVPDFVKIIMEIIHYKPHPCHLDKKHMSSFSHHIQCLVLMISWSSYNINYTPISKVPYSLLIPTI